MKTTQVTLQITIAEDELVELRTKMEEDQGSDLEHVEGKALLRDYCTQQLTSNAEYDGFTIEVKEMA